MTDEILAVDKWASNAHLIADCAKLGYLRKEWTTLDPTYGKGNFWSKWRPDILVGHDILSSLSPDGKSHDATDLPYDDRSFDAVVIDGPYKLNGTSQGTGPAASDKSYGVDVPRTWQERMALLDLMLVEGARIADKMLLFKCQAQVVSGAKRWQPRIFANKAEEELGFVQVDEFHFLGHRKQPTHNVDGSPRRQVTARSNYSTLLVLKRG